MINADELIKMNRSQLFEAAAKAHDEGNLEQEKKLRGLLIQQADLINKMSRPELSELLYNITSDDLKKSEVVCRRLSEYERDERKAVSAMLPKNATKEQVEEELKRVTTLISELTGKAITPDSTWDTLFEELSCIDSPYIESALAAVNWWEATLSNPDRDEFYKMSNDKVLDLPMNPSPLNESTIPMFKTYLLARILKVMETSRTHICIVTNDYEPEGLLSDVAKITGLSATDFPFQTATSIEPDKASIVKYNSEELLYSKDERMGLSSR